MKSAVAQLARALRQHLEEEFLPGDIIWSDQPEAKKTEAPSPAAPQLKGVKLTADIPQAKPQTTKETRTLSVAVIMGSEPPDQRQVLHSLVRALEQRGIAAGAVDPNRQADWVSDQLKVVVSSRPLQLRGVKVIPVDLGQMVQQPHTRKGVWEAILGACGG